jgi:hypothetical protein
MEKARQIKIAVAAKMRVMQKPRRHPLKKGQNWSLCYCRRLSGKSKCLLNNSLARTAFFDWDRHIWPEFA